MSDNQPKSKLGPIPPENFDGEPAFRETDELRKSYSDDTNQSFDELLEQLQKETK